MILLLLILFICFYFQLDTCLPKGQDCGARQIFEPTKLQFCAVTLKFEVYIYSYVLGIRQVYLDGLMDTNYTFIITLVNIYKQ